MLKPKILLVEDDPKFGSVLRNYLDMNDYQVHLCTDGESGLEAARANNYELAILDVMMPKMDGFTLANKIKESKENLPIIFLTAKAMKEDVITGFQVGADDYLTKPFDSEVLLYKIKAIIKRSSEKGADPMQREFDVGKFHFNYHLRTITDGKTTHKLSPKESDLLKLLLLHKNDLLPREKALRDIWGDDSYFTARSMDVFITKLRKYFKDDPAINIMNLHGKGFRMIVPQEETD